MTYRLFDHEYAFEYDHEYGCLPRKNKLYLGNKMSGKPFFNAPWFNASAAILRTLPSVGEVFNPAEHDQKIGFDLMLCPNGTPDEAEEAGFDLCASLAADYSWICEFSDGLIVGPDWPDSPGTISEIAVHQALRLPVWEFDTFVKYWEAYALYELALPPIMKL